MRKRGLPLIGPMLHVSLKLVALVAFAVTMPYAPAGNAQPAVATRGFATRKVGFCARNSVAGELNRLWRYHRYACRRCGQPRQLRRQWAAGWLPRAIRTRAAMRPASDRAVGLRLYGADIGCAPRGLKGDRAESRSSSWRTRFRSPFPLNEVALWSRSRSGAKNLRSAS